MQPLTLSKELAIEIYNGADAKTKEKMEQKFGKETFVPVKKWKLIKTFEDAYKSLGIKTYGDAYRILKMKRKMFSDTPIEQCDDETLRLMIEIKAVNGDWEADMDDENESRWYPWFKRKRDSKNKVSSGFVFRSACYDDSVADASSASRLCLETEEKAIYVAIQFEPDWNSFLI